MVLDKRIAVIPLGGALVAAQNTALGEQAGPGVDPAQDRPARRQAPEPPQAPLVHVILDIVAGANEDQVRVRYGVDCDIGVNQDPAAGSHWLSVQARDLPPVELPAGDAVRLPHRAETGAERGDVEGRHQGEHDLARAMGGSGTPIRDRRRHADGFEVHLDRFVEFDVFEGMHWRRP